MTSPQSDRTTTRRRWALRLHAFSALRHRNYVYLWLADSFGSTANWVQQVALALLVADLTDSSAFWVGTVLGIRALPVLLIGPLAGVAIDRMDRKTLFMATQLFLFVTAFLFAWGVSVDKVNEYHALVFSFLLGADLSVNRPVRLSLIANVVPREDLSNAVALENSASNIIRVFAPAVGIALITPFGLAGNFFIQAGAYLAVFLMIIPMRTPYREGVAETTSVIRNFMEGLRYIKADAALLLLIVLIIIPSVLVHSTQFLLVIFADKELPGDKEVVLVILYTSMGVGALLGTLTMASLGNFQRRGLVNMGAMMAVTLLLVVFGLSPYLVLSAVIIGLLGLFNQLFRIANNSLVQARTPDVLRGREQHLPHRPRRPAPGHPPAGPAGFGCRSRAGHRHRRSSGPGRHRFHRPALAPALGAEVGARRQGPLPLAPSPGEGERSPVAHVPSPPGRGLG